MQAASDDMDFEQAARVRDRIRALSAISMENSVSAEGVAEADVFALHSDGGQACVQVFFYRGGQNWGGRAYFPRVDKTDTDPEILGAFLGQFYEDKPVPRQILSNVTPHEKELLEEAFSMKARIVDGRRVVSIEKPARGDRKALVDHALTNAREALGRKMAESSAQSKIIDEVCEALRSGHPPGADRDLRQRPHLGHQRRGRHGVAGLRASARTSTASSTSAART
jgi:excinuclease ABC subunit C